MNRANAAKQLSLLLNLGVVTAHEVIAWAESQILETEFSAPLLDLSTTDATRIGEVISHLNRLSEGANFWEAFRAMLPRLHEHLLAHPSEADRVNFIVHQTLRTFARVPEQVQWLDPVAFQGMWPARHPDGWIISIEGICLARLSDQGEIWRTRRLAWDGLTDIKVTDLEITGLAWGPERYGIPFRVDSRTGLAAGGSFG